jgi:tRNA-2-methylthio-N6-dimethylallyladenosine synthase
MSLPRVQSAALESVAPDPAETNGESSAGSKLHVVTFGCQMNKYDSTLVEGRFRRRGWSTTGEIGDADLILFNTCSVRDHAEERVHSWVGELKREKARRPELMIGVMGCMAERMGEDLFARSGHVDLVVGTRSFQHLPDLVDDLRERRAAGVRPRDARVLRTGLEERPDAPREGDVYTGGLQAYLAVMRGCDLNCTFCIVPTVRGRVLSRPIEALVDEARWMTDQGARVVTLLGQTVNSYGEDLPVPGPGQSAMRGRKGRPSLADLIYRLQEVDGLERIRLITLHPAYVTPALAEAIRDCDKCDRFLPLPAQSGSDRILKAMKRGYTVDLYRRRLDILRAAVPDIELGSDWIVGFPGETEQDYVASERLLEEIGSVVNYVFKYDGRPGTRADELEDDVAVADKKDRNNRLLRVAERVALGRMESHLGAERHVFVEDEREREPGRLRGRTEHGLPCSFDGVADLIGTQITVRAENASAYGLSATVVSPTST